MNVQRHGITIGIERINSDFFLTLKLSGKLSHEDYEKITPMLDSALMEVKQPHIKALVDVTELKGWELKSRHSVCQNSHLWQPKLVRNGD